MKCSKKPLVCFALFEPIDQWSISNALKLLKREAHIDVKLLGGLTYDDYVRKNKVNPKKYPESLYKDKINFKRPDSESGKIFLSLVNDKFRSLETGVLLRRIEAEKSCIESIIRGNKKLVFVIPEDTDAVKGRLVSLIAERYGVKTIVMLPLYYDWITSCPLLGHRKADFWIVPGINYKRRLLKQGISRKKILVRKLDLPRQYAGSRKAVKYNVRKPYYIAALQNNDEQELFVQLLVEAFENMPEKRLVVKFHPATPTKVKKTLKKIFSRKNIYFADKDGLNTLIKNCLGLITISSTTALQAMFYNKPVIIAHMGWFFHDLEELLMRTGGFWVFSSPDELAEAIKKLDYKEYRKKYLLKQGTVKNEYFEKLC